MMSLYLFFLTFKILSTLMCAGLCYKIGRLKLTPTFTYMLFFAGFSLRFLTQVEALWFTKDILGLWASYNFWLILVNQFVEVLIIGCFLIGLSRKYYALKGSLNNIQ